MDVLAELTQPSPPATLYHYTNQDGLLGIMDSDSLWATKIQYLNDSTEYLHAIELAEELINERLDGESNTKEIEKIKGIQRDLRGITYLNVCIASFSEKKDILSQWRAYGGGAGFSIGFKSSTLLEQAKSQGFIVAQCIYQEEEQRSLVSQLLDDTLAVDFNTKPLSRDPDKPRTYVAHPTDGGFLMNLVKIAPVIKSKAFQEEQEWRLISTRGISVRNMLFRKGRSMVVPYVEFNLGHVKEEYLDRIIVGPTPNTSLSKRSIESLLGNWDAAQNVKTDLSEVPFRDW